jgi:transposase
VLHRRGVIRDGDLFTRDGRKQLAELPLDAAGRSILDRYLSQLDSIDQAVSDSTKQLRELARQQRWCKSLALLNTMPGVGLITGLSILAELGDIHRFKSRASVSNWAGLVPVIRDSNNKHFAGHITRRGSAHLRATLTEAAWQSIRRSRRYSSLYERISVHKSKPIAIIAVARRMLEDAWTMLKKDEVFRDGESSDSPVQTAAVMSANADATVAPNAAG